MNFQPSPAETDTEFELDWPAMLDRAADGCGMRAVYQPIADLAGGHVTGYEALIRFVGYPVRNPNPWFAAAHVHGDNPELQATALRIALSERATLPPGCFLTVNVGPEALDHPGILRVWHDEGDLHDVVIELTESLPSEDQTALEPALRELRRAGARLAADYTDNAHARLRALRPDLIKLPHDLTTGITENPAKRAAVTAAKAFAAGIDARVLAQGIETRAELETLIALGVPLGQGYHLGRPARPWAAIGQGSAATFERRPERSAATPDSRRS